jgi:sucrose phosphorylase
MDEIAVAADKDVVRRLERLIRLRNTHPAFDGEFRVLDSAENRLVLAWSADDAECVLDVDLASVKSIVRCVDSQGRIENVSL